MLNNKQLNLTNFNSYQMDSETPSSDSSQFMPYYGLIKPKILSNKIKKKKKKEQKQYSHYDYRILEPKTKKL